jgi:tRNA(Ile)-lysidine synthase
LPALSDFSLESLWRELDGLPGAARDRRYCVAFSGGLDSTVLLTALAWLSDRFQPGGLRAAHVHHGLHPDAERWVEQCRACCRALELPLEVCRVDARPAPGESPEARAREVRYTALKGQLASGEILLTAHHADDQIETVLIQLLRGAGVAGLAGMPADTVFGAGRHQRPLLAFTRTSLLDWAAAQGLADWIEDPGNTEARFARNHLRHEVLPAIRAQWPAAAAAVSRAARHCAEASELAEALAGLDARHCADGDALSVPAMRELSPARCRNLVRWQARRLGLPVPDERRLSSLLDQVMDAAGHRQPQVRWPGVIAARHADRLWLMPATSLPDPLATLAWPDPRSPLELGPGLGVFSLEPSENGGLRPECLALAPWRVVGRRGGERIRLPGRAGSRSLKKLLNAAGVPPWLRLRMPLVEIGGRLAAVGDLWVDESCWAPSGSKALRLRWQGCSVPGRNASIVGEQAF